MRDLIEHCLRGIRRDEDLSDTANNLKYLSGFAILIGIPDPECIEPLLGSQRIASVSLTK